MEVKLLGKMFTGKAHCSMSGIRFKHEGWSSFLIFQTMHDFAQLTQQGSRVHKECLCCQAPQNDRMRAPQMLNPKSCPLKIDGLSFTLLYINLALFGVLTPM